MIAVSKFAGLNAGSAGRSEFGERGNLSRSDAHANAAGRSAMETNMVGPKTSAGKQQGANNNSNHFAHDSGRQQQRNRETVYLKKGLKAARSSISGGSSSASSSSSSLSLASLHHNNAKWKQQIIITIIMSSMALLAGFENLRPGRLSCQMALAWLLLLLFWP